MNLFPQEYGDQATALHKLAVVLSVVLIAGSIFGMAAFFVLKGSPLPPDMRKALGIVALAGAPAGFIII